MDVWTLPRTLCLSPGLVTKLVVIPDIGNNYPRSSTRRHPPSGRAGRPLGLQPAVVEVLVMFPARPQPGLDLLLPLVAAQAEDVSVEAESVLQVNMPANVHIVFLVNDVI